MAQTRPLSDAEYETLKSALSGRMVARDRCLVVMLRVGGFRISELLSLRLADVVEQGQITPMIHVARRHMKGRRRGRDVPVHPDARAALEAWIAVMAEAGRQTAEMYLFHALGRENRPITRQQAGKVMRTAARSPAARLAGHIAPHSLRKSFGLEVYRLSGFNIRIAQEALGHASVESTIRYLGVAREDLLKVLMGLQGRMAGPA